MDSWNRFDRTNAPYNNGTAAQTHGRGGGRTASSNQGNYYQQQNMKGTYGAQQSRNTRSNSGSTNQQFGGYRNSTQPTFGYNTSSPQAPVEPKKEVQSQQSPVQQPQIQQPPPSVVKQPEATTPALSTPEGCLKQESVPQTQPSDTAEAQEENTNTPPFARKKRPLVKVSNKVKRARQNAKLRRILTPKNALTFLNELRPGEVKFVLKEDPLGGFIASIDIDGNTFKGHGTSMSKAKVNASEQAVRHLLLEKLNKSQQESSSLELKEENDDNKEDASEDGNEPAAKKPKLEPAKDQIPWGSLASFALHKLFSEWQKGEKEFNLLPPAYPTEKYNEDIPLDYTWHPGPPLPGEMGFPRRSFTPFPPPRNRWFGPRFNVSVPPRHLPPPPVTAPHFNTRPPPLVIMGTKVQPMKKIPEDANKRHPVMLLNQLKPGAVYNETKEGELGNFTFVISVEVDGNVYTGRGKNKKDARKQAAKAALLPLGIVYADGE